MARKFASGNRKESKKVNNSNHTLTTPSSSSHANRVKPMSTGPGLLSSSTDRVFGNDLLCEEILKYAIHGNNNKISGKRVKTARLVQKSWLQATTRILLKSRKPLIALTVDRNANVELLGQLVKRFGASERLQQSFLPLKLNFNVQFFHRTNFQILSACLTGLGSDLVELQVEYPKSGGTMPATFPRFSLPILRKFTFQFSDEPLLKGDGDDGYEFDDNRNGLGLLQSTLNATTGLTDLVIPFTRRANVVPAEFQYISLPPTLVVLDMRIKLMSKDIEIFQRNENELHNLSHLIFSVHEIPFEDTFLFKILEKLRKTLQTLKINGLKSSGHPRPHTLLRLPSMDKLKTLEIVGPECELDPGNVSALQVCLPKLAVVKLEQQTEATLAKWTQNSKFEKVGRLFVSVVNEELEEENDSYYISPSFEILAQLQHSFPNVGRMSLSFNISDLIGLKFLFRNMGQLRMLNINVFGNEAALNNGSDLIDAAFLGLSPQLVAALKADIETTEIEIKSCTQPSILNLSELKTLALQSNTAKPHSLMSDLLFRYAFMKMPKLRNLFLVGKFQPSLEMQQSWKSEGRFIKYFAA